MKSVLLLFVMVIVAGCGDRHERGSASRKVSSQVTLAADSAKSISAVVPRIYGNLGGERAALSVSGDDSPVVRPLVADLLVLYGFDVGAHYELVSVRDLARLAVTKEQLHERSLENLRARKFEVKAHRGERVTMLTAGGDYEAALLLLPEVWHSVAQMVSGSLVVSAPARDVVYVTGDADPMNVAELRQATARMIAKADKSLSSSLIRWTGTQWQEYPKSAK